MDWTEKYRPTTLSEVRGNDKARDEFAEWGRSWDDHRKAVILHGSPGIGKTSAAHALANDMGWKTVELNASDKRTGDVIERFAGRAAMNATLAGSSEKTGDESADRRRNRQLVILDEADNIHGNYDRGGASAITRLVKESEQPIVLIANEFYEMSRGLRNACEDIEFRDVSARSIVPVLRDICRRESLEYDSDALQHIAEANGGDLRGAVNDLQAAAEGKEKVTVEDVVTGSRDQSMDIFAFLDAVLKEQSPQEALQSSYAVDETPDDLTKWIEGNVTKVYEGEELARAYEFLANADRWLGRVRASQNYSYWRYAGDNLAAGVAASRDGTKGGWTRFGRPQFWPSSDKTADYVARKIAERSGVSMDTARRDVIPFLAAMTHHCKPRELTVAMAAAYDLEESHVSFVTGSGETTNKVESIVEDARALREEQMKEHSGSAFEGAVRSDDADDDEEPPTSTVEDAAVAANGGETADADAADDEDDGQSGLDDFF
ncbi:replication factor C large subunit [Halogranum amylolyticum]|uniref:Replication factor C large subunit n=1 Tax=Halogranum amylolyticum TaxID=660520 RepID=A0A1H8RJX1_9EURY|nr:replication factor C large subunit [Halogranum amylolyticum]SEO66839.1 replication factor C large subunit [Halogranum amylolyticum]